jgi:hypothetical protein
MYGSRVTDEVSFYGNRGEQKGAVRAVRIRPPDPQRWRSAVSFLTKHAGILWGLERMRIEEPVREVVLDLSELVLKREVVLDARRNNVDLDRGELLPRHRMGDLRRMAFLVGTDVGQIARYVRLPEDFGAPIDTAAVAIVSRAYGDMHRRRAHKLFLDLPRIEEAGQLPPKLRPVHARARRDAELAKRWTALSRALLGQEGQA